MAVLSEEKRFDDYFYRKLRVKWKNKEDNIIERIVHHLQYTEWPDHGCPEGVKHVLEFVELLNKHKKEESQNHENNPILLHCR